MTDITKLLDEHPLPWRSQDARDGYWVVVDAKDVAVFGAQRFMVGYWSEWIAAIANALHAERQKSQLAALQAKPKIPWHAYHGPDGPPPNDSGDVDALRYRIGELERRVRAVESEPLEINDLRDEIRWLDNVLWSVFASIMKGSIKNPQDFSSWIQAGIERRGMYADIVRYRREARGSDE